MFSDHPLDNIAWHALNGPHEAYSEGGGFGAGLARRYRSDISIWGAAERLDAESWHALADLSRPQGFAAVMRANLVEPPPELPVIFRSTAAQLIAPELHTERSDIVELGMADADDMLALATLTEPGPFTRRTGELGRFVGIHDNTGKLLAMAGERFRAQGWVEVSAVCTHPDARGHGYAAALTAAIVEGIQARGDGAFLHVREGNTSAERLYERLGFKLRRAVGIVGVSTSVAG
jgi:predicted GNAT family acetyltransferase